MVDATASAGPAVLSVVLTLWTKMLYGKFCKHLAFSKTENMGLLMAAYEHK